MNLSLRIFLNTGPDNNLYIWKELPKNTRYIILLGTWLLHFLNLQVLKKAWELLKIEVGIFPI